MAFAANSASLESTIISEDAFVEHPEMLPPGELTLRERMVCQQVFSEERERVRSISQLRRVLWKLNITIPETRQSEYEAFLDSVGVLTFDSFLEVVKLTKKHTAEAQAQGDEHDLLDAFVTLGGTVDGNGSIRPAAISTALKEFGVSLDLDPEQDDNQECITFDSFHQFFTEEMEDDDDAFSQQGRVGSPIFGNAADGDGTKENDGEPKRMMSMRTAQLVTMLAVKFPKNRAGGARQSLTGGAGSFRLTGVPVVKQGGNWTKGIGGGRRGSAGALPDPNATDEQMAHSSVQKLQTIISQHNSTVSGINRQRKRFLKFHQSGGAGDGPDNAAAGGAGSTSPLALPRHGTSPRKRATFKRPKRVQAASLPPIHRPKPPTDTGGFDPPIRRALVPRPPAGGTYTSRPRPCRLPPTDPPIQWKDVGPFDESLISPSRRVKPLSDDEKNMSMESKGSKFDPKSEIDKKLQMGRDARTLIRQAKHNVNRKERVKKVFDFETKECPLLRLEIYDLPVSLPFVPVPPALIPGTANEEEESPKSNKEERREEATMEVQEDEVSHAEQAEERRSETSAPLTSTVAEEKSEATEVTSGNVD